MPNQSDQPLAEQLINERRRRTRLDGGIGGWVVATSWSAYELMQLGCPPDHTGVVRMVGYLLSRQDKPGRYGEGCDDDRHENGLCSHFLPGFFSPGSIDEPVAPLHLPYGVDIEGESSARFAASCFALRTVLQARQERRPAVINHIESLLSLGRRWEAGELTPDPSLIMTALAALSLVPISYRDEVEGHAQRVFDTQAADGTWDGVSLFHGLDTMLGLSFPGALDCIRRAGPSLLDRQKPDGSFDETGDEELALVALRALRSMGGLTSAPKPPRFSGPSTRPSQRHKKRAGR